MPIDVLTNRYSNSRTGVNDKEGQLVKGKISTKTFGKLFSRTVDGDLYAQPLIVSDLPIGGIKRNVVYLATSRNWVYAYDADDPSAYLPIWTRSLGLAAPRDAIFKGYLNFSGEVGVISTPVIQRDGKGGTIFLVAKTMHFAEGGQRVFKYKLHALNILTGKDRREPMLIEASVKNANGQVLNLDPQLNLNRPGLLLQGGALYIAFGSQGDVGEFYGWILAYNAKTLSQIAVYNTAPDWGEGGVWQSGTGLAGDEKGFVYAAVGNGEKTKNRKKPDKVEAPIYGNALLKLKLEKPRGGPATLQPMDWFTASDVFDLNDQDQDFTGGPVLFEAPASSGKTLKLLLGGGKDGNFYLANRDKLGHWAQPTNPEILQAEKLTVSHIHGAPVVWRRKNGDIRAFVWSEKDFLKVFAFNGASFDRVPLSTSNYGLPQNENRMPGGVLALSWDGQNDDTAVIWAAHPTYDDANNKSVLGTLRAYDALDLNNELWTSDTDAAGNDRLGSLAKFNPPVVANGKVYVGTFSRELVVYGLFEEPLPASRANDLGIFELRNIGGNSVQKSGSYICGKYELRISGHGIDTIPVTNDRGETQIGKWKDEFLFANVQRNLGLGEVEVTARVDGINAPSYPNALAGVTIRREFDADERFAAVIITNQDEALFLHRDNPQEIVKHDGPVKVTLPIFIRIIARNVDGEPGIVEFTGKTSKDGSNWSTLSAVTKIKMDDVPNIDLKAGLAVSAQTGADIATASLQAHATFSCVDVTG